jgi:hypothetical protein
VTTDTASLLAAQARESVQMFKFAVSVNSDKAGNELFTISYRDARNIAEALASRRTPAPVDTTPVTPDFVQQAVNSFVAEFSEKAKGVVDEVAKTARSHANARQSLMDQRDDLQAENTLIRRCYSGLKAFAVDVSRDPLNHWSGRAQQLLTTGVYERDETALFPSSPAAQPLSDAAWELSQEAQNGIARMQRENLAACQSVAAQPPTPQDAVEAYYAKTKDHPSEARRYKRDIEPVINARAALSPATPAPGKI